MSNFAVYTFISENPACEYNCREPHPAEECSDVGNSEFETIYGYANIARKWVEAELWDKTHKYYSYHILINGLPIENLYDPTLSMDPGDPDWDELEAISIAFKHLVAIKDEKHFALKLIEEEKVAKEKREEEDRLLRVAEKKALSEAADWAEFRRLQKKLMGGE